MWKLATEFIGVELVAQERNCSLRFLFDRTDNFLYKVKSK
jgi:hypothetical protein